ncbi:hypothetical protein V5N11_008920 [Cardamine amara subsp. amara]|uniref:Transmembrane protein n=1 Tax=Cardamine amara subsp. amara TaxID=228776 RepID=A0ABD1BAZ8_CARAN
MGFLNVVKEVAGILNESRKLFLKNKKLMFSVFIFPLLLQCLVYLFNILVIQPELTNLILEASLLPTADPSSPEYIVHLMKLLADLRQFVSSSYIFLAVSSIITLLSVVAIVHASALTHKGENIKIKDFLVLTLKSWRGPLVTYFYIALFTFGYMFFFYIILFPIILFSTTTVVALIALAAEVLALLILFAVFQFYLAIVWYLSMVISTLEETYGIQALGKAAKIVKGMKPRLFLLNLCFSLLYCGLGAIMGLTNSTSSFAVTLTVSLVLVTLIYAVSMFQLVTYTVAYFQCTGHQGKDVESLKDVEYTTLMGNAP